MQQWCGENRMELNIQNTKIIFFTRKPNSTHFKSYVKDVLILRSDCIKRLGVMSDIKVHSYCHVYFVYSQTLRTLRPIRFIAHNVSSLDSLVVLYVDLIRSKLEYASHIE
jgi:hypothetical protein